MCDKQFLIELSHGKIVDETVLIIHELENIKGNYAQSKANEGLGYYPRQLTRTIENTLTWYEK